MRGRWIIITSALGVLALLTAVTWSALLEPRLVRFPDDVDRTVNYTGTLSLYADPVTGQFLDTPIELPMHALRQIQAVGEGTTGDTVVVEETITRDLGNETSTESHVYAMDRRSILNVDAPQAYAYTPTRPIDRSGAHRLTFPLGTTADGTYPFWANQIDDAYVIDGGGTETETAGLDTITFHVVFEEPVGDSYAAILAAQGLPTEVTVEELAPQLRAAGLSLEDALTVIQGLLTDLQFQGVLEVLSQPLPLTYSFGFDGDVVVEPTTGSIVALIDVTELVTVKPDFSSFGALLPLLADHGDEPEVAMFAAALTSFADSPGQPVIEANYSQDPESITTAVDEATSMRRSVRLATTYLPWGLGVLGGILLVVAAGLQLGRRDDPDDRWSDAESSNDAELVSMN